jgi:class III lanthionine synthetase
LKLIDFEGAYELGVDRPSGLYTPGFVSQDRLAGCTAAMQDDYYSAGAVLMSYLFPITGLFHLNPKARHQLMAAIQRDAQIPPTVSQMILALMEPDAESRPQPAAISAILKNCSAGEPVQAQPENSLRDYSGVVNGIVTHLNDVAAYPRQDRLFPTDQKLFATNPVSLAWGASGIGYALSKVTDSPQEDVSAWILRHRITSDQYAPGLYAGMAGVAWCLLEMGKDKEGEEILSRTFNHDLLNQSADIFYGMAGWGMTCLRFFVETGNQLYLDKACQAGRLLLKKRQQAQGLCHWGGSNIALGFAHGASGIATFLLYLYLVTRQEEFLAAGQSGLEFDLQHAVTTKDDGLSWRESVHGNSPLYPYWQNGSAGVGMSVLRYWRLLGNQRYWSILEKIYLDVDRKYAVFPGRFMGLAGLGDFLMDMYETSRETRFLQSAHKVAEGIMQFQVERRGIAFPGDSISRLSCSYANGSAGIAVFLNRLSGKKGYHFMLDCLFEQGERDSANGQVKQNGIYAGASAPVMR